MSLLVEAIVALANNHVDFVVVGGMAGLYMLNHNGEKWLIVAESEKIKG